MDPTDPKHWIQHCSRPGSSPASVQVIFIYKFVGKRQVNFTNWILSSPDETVPVMRFYLRQKKITCLKVDSSPLLWSVYLQSFEHLGSVINQFLLQ
jgi:hypothetical protein